MADEKELKQLELRIVELENKLAAATKRSTPASLTAEELKAYQKVRDVIAADWGDMCGINDCYRCIVVRCSALCVSNCVVRCINECTCGPCSQGHGGLGGVGYGRFGGLGE